MYVRNLEKENLHFQSMITKVWHSILFLMLSLGLFSCSFPVPQKFKENFECFSGKYTGLDTLINTHGFYTQMFVIDNTGLSTWKNGKRVEMGIDTSFYSFMFFTDGIFIGDIGYPGLTVPEYINHCTLKGEHVWGSIEGIYTVSGDTIKIKWIGSGGHANNQWYGREIWYKVIDRNTILDFYSKPLVVLREDRKKEEYQPKTYLNAEASKFVYVPNMPESSSWLKKEKWFWCDSVK